MKTINFCSAVSFALAGFFSARVTSAIPVNTTVLVSKSTDGTISNGTSGTPFISDNGRFVVFHSTASNLVAGDGNGKYDVFLHDTKKGITTRLSVNALGVEGNDDSYAIDISDNGRYVVFTSKASNLVDNDTNASEDAFLADTKLGTLTRVSVSSSGEEGNTSSYADGISKSGRYILISSYATNLVSDDTNGLEDVFLKDTKTGAVTLVSRSRPGASSEECYSNNQSISEDKAAKYILFVCANTAPSDTSSVYRYDRKKDITELVSVDANGTQIVGNHNRGVMSGDGRYVAFYSSAAVVTEDTNDDFDTYLRDLKKDKTTLLITGLGGALPDQGTLLRSMSSDARYFTYVSLSSNLDAIGGNGSILDVYRFDRKKRKNERISIGLNGELADDESNWPILSSDGSRVTFYSEASNLTADADNNLLDIFVRRMKIAKKK